MKDEYIFPKYSEKIWDYIKPKESPEKAQPLPIPPSRELGARNLPIPEQWDLHPNLSALKPIRWDLDPDLKALLKPYEKKWDLDPELKAALKPYENRWDRHCDTTAMIDSYLGMPKKEPCLKDNEMELRTLAALKLCSTEELLEEYFRRTLKTKPVQKTAPAPTETEQALTYEI